jgi:predicted PurR-regulated permease PerM
VEHNRWFRTLLILLVFIAGLYLAGVLWQLFGTVGDILLLFFLAWLIAFAVSPLAHRAQTQWGLPWPLAVLTVYAGVIVALVLGFLLVLPSTVEQAGLLATALPTYAEQAPRWLDQGQAWLRERGLDVSLVWNEDLARDLAARAQAIGSELAGSTLAFAQGVLTAVFNLVVVLILSFYMSLDGERLVARALDLLPPAVRAQAEVFVESVGRSFGGYLRGVLIQGIIYGLATALVMWAAGLPFVAVVGIFAGVMMVVPIVGAIIAMVPPVLLALFTGDIGKIILVVVVLFVAQQVLLNLLMPRIMSQSVGLHPLLVFAALLIGARVAGIWGAVFGVPVAAVAYSMANYFIEQNQRSRPVSVEMARADARLRRRDLAWLQTLVRRRRSAGGRRPRGDLDAGMEGAGTAGETGNGLAARDERPAQEDIPARP